MPVDVTIVIKIAHKIHKKYGKKKCLRICFIEFIRFISQYELRNLASTSAVWASVWMSQL